MFINSFVDDVTIAGTSSFTRSIHYVNHQVIEQWVARGYGQVMGQSWPMSGEFTAWVV